MTEGRDRPRLSENQTLLSPVVLAGPPRLSFKKPVVLSFGHSVADASDNGLVLCGLKKPFRDVSEGVRNMILNRSWH